MKIPSSSDNFPSFGTLGVSMRGPAHAREGVPCEDHWSVHHRKGMTTIAVSDGMGGCSAAREAARAACKVAHDCALVWSRGARAVPEDFMALFALMWKMWLGDRDVREFGATLLIAVIRNDGEAQLFQLGDGLVGWLLEDETFHRLQDRESGFSNLTCGVGDATKSSAWRHACLKAEPDWRVIVLATDGVADDLREDALPSFLGLLATEAISNGAAETRAWLRSEFRNWPTPKHLDDKTLAICWRKPSNA